MIQIKPSDLYYKYPKNHARRQLAKFSGLPDDEPFDRDDLYEVLPMFEHVMDALGAADDTVLHKMEEVLDLMPSFVQQRGDVYTYLCEVLSDMLGIEYKK
nr:hypothetical protein [uncultured Desulfuromonas sp.]